MAAQQLDRQERLARCEDLESYVSDKPTNDRMLQQSTEELSRVADVEKILRENSESTYDGLSTQYRRLKRGLQGIKDYDELNAERLLHAGKKMKQAMFGGLAAAALGRDGDLDNLRNISPGHRNALLSSERDQLRKKLDDTQRRASLATLSNRELRDRLDLLEDRLEETETLLDVKTEQLKRLHKVKDKEIRALENRISTMECGDHGLARYFAVQSGRRGVEDFRTWLPFVQCIRDTDWVQYRVLSSSWTILPSWGLYFLDPEPDQPTGLVELLARLYGTVIPGALEEPTQWLHLLIRELESANIFPLGVVVAVLGRLLDGIERMGIEGDFSLQLFLVAILQTTRCTLQQMDRVNASIEAIKIRIEALMSHSGAYVTRLAELLESDGESQLTRALHATRDHDQMHDRRSSIMLFSGSQFALMKLSESRSWIWVISEENHTVRAVACERGRWDETSTAYRIISGMVVEPDIVLECPDIAEKYWLLKNIPPSPVI
ncbi:hypothetical protein F5Y13DRAFT_193192 [Hypoxylon sp. FL1857]|nr:hypothetical protein F5Y13DRAFT_193192 [Hypoxylon sp. FL1857]